MAYPMIARLIRFISFFVVITSSVTTSFIEKCS
jgi:hypothetical protein